jgi:hypothetical protein
MPVWSGSSSELSGAFVLILLADDRRVREVVRDEVQSSADTVLVQAL